MAFQITYPAFTFDGTSGGNLNVTYPAFSLALTQQFDSAGSFDITLPNFRMRYSSTSQTSGTLNITYPDFTLALTGGTSSAGSFSFSIPSMPSQFWTRSVRVLVMNTDTLQSPVEYSNFDFNSIIMYNGNVYLASSSGLFKVAGTDDNGSDIDAYIETMESDFGSPDLKTIDEIAIGTKGGEALIQTFHDATYNSALGTEATTDMVTKRIKHPKGIRQRYWGVKVSNVDGGTLDLDTITLNVNIHSRKVNQ